jgi:1,4-alpha-glucan branching enzyme
MLKREISGNGMTRVTFRISKHLWADRVALIGEFNDWDPHAHLLQQAHLDADWHTTLELEMGHAYRFRYLVDEEHWMDDDQADGYELSPDGGVDSVVYV